MVSASALLNCKSHRPFSYPGRTWKYYQEWDETLFLHWKVPAELLWELLPPGLLLDTIHGEAWVSVVAFTVKDMRFRYLPPLPYVSDFNEVNLRTYVIRDGIPGIYFLTVEAGKKLSVTMARLFVGIKYQKARIKRGSHSYSLSRSNEGNMLKTKYVWLENISEKSNVDKWLTERYCAYELIHNHMYRFNIHHKPWPLKKLKLRRLNISYYKGPLEITERPHLQHYAPQQKVLLWGREKC